MSETIDANQLHAVLEPSAPKAYPRQAEGAPGWHLAEVNSWKRDTRRTIMDVLLPIEDIATANALRSEEGCIKRKLEQSITTRSQCLHTAFDTLLTYPYSANSALMQKMSHILELPSPSPLLLQNPYFAQRMLQYLHDRLPEERKHMAGVLLSMLLRNALTDLSGDTQNTHQIINLSHIGPLDGIAIFWLRGKLTILGNAGHRTAMAMSSGELFIPESTGNGTLSYMCGGKAHIGKTGESLGQCMSGGTIFVSHAGPYAGYNMSGGSIHAGEAEHDYGKEAIGGMITVAAEGKVLRPKKSWFRRR